MKKIRIITAIALAFVMCLSFTSCTSEFQDNVKYVTETLLNTPNDTLIEVFVEMMNSPVSEDESGAILFEKADKLDATLYDTFGDYFSEKHYETFIAKYSPYAFINSVTTDGEARLIDSGATSTVKDFTIFDSYDRNEFFEFILECVNSKGETTDIEIHGRAQPDDNGKILFYELYSGMDEYDRFFME